MKTYAKINGAMFQLLSSISLSLISWKLCKLPVNYDDSYITFRYAKNFAEGNGLVYNANEKVYGISNLLYTLLIGSLSRISGLPPERVSEFLTIVLVFFTLLIVYKISTFYALKVKFTILLQALLLVTPLFLTIAYMGMETPLYSLLILISIYAFIKQKFFCLGLAVGLVVCTRLDGAILGIPILALLSYKIWKKKITMKEAYRSLIGVILPLIFYVSVSLHYFNSVVPSTISVKMNQPKSAPRFWMLEWFYKGPAFPVVVLIIMYLILISINRNIVDKKNMELIILVAGWIAVYALAWTLVGIDLYPWYLAALSPIFTLIFIPILSLNLSRSFDFLITTSLIILIASWGLYSGHEQVKTGIYVQQVEVVRKEIADEIRSNSNGVNEIVGTGAPGIIGYFCGGCTVVDYGGLVTPLADRLKPTTLQVTYEKNPLVVTSAIDQESELLFASRGQILNSPLQSLYRTIDSTKSSWSVEPYKSSSYQLSDGVMIAEVIPLNNEINLSESDKYLKFKMKMKLNLPLPSESLISFYIVDQSGKRITYLDTTGLFDNQIPYSKLKKDQVYLNVVNIPLPSDLQRSTLELDALVYPSSNSLGQNSLRNGKTGGSIRLFYFKIVR